MKLLDLAKAKTETLAAARHLDLQALQPSINRLAKGTSRKPPARSQCARHQHRVALTST